MSQQQLPPAATSQEDPALSDVYLHIQQAVKKAVDAESTNLKSQYEGELKRVREEREGYKNVALKYKTMLDERTLNDKDTRVMKDKMERIKNEVVASNERILKMITEQDDVTSKNDAHHATMPSAPPDAAAGAGAVLPKEKQAKQAMLMIINKPPQDLTLSPGAPSSSTSAAARPKTTSPKKVMPQAKTDKTSTAAKRSKLSASLSEPSDSEDSHTDDGKSSAEDAYFLYEKAHSDRNHKVDFSDCRLETLALTTVDFVGFARHFHLNDAQKEIVVQQYTSLLKVPVQEVNGSCIVCGSFCNKGATGIFCSHVTCAKCFAMYLYFAGEKIQGNWKTKNRYLKCPGVVLNKQCNYMTTQ
jgi:hypothetical protein